MFYPMDDFNSGIGNDRGVSQLIAQGDIKQIPYQSETDETKAGDFTGRLSTFLVLVLLSLTASLAAPSSKLALCIARTPHESGASVSGDGAQLLRGHGRIDCFALRSSKR